MNRMNKRIFLKLLFIGAIAVSASSKLRPAAGAAIDSTTEAISHPWLKSCGILNRLDKG